MGVPDSLRRRPSPGRRLEAAFAWRTAPARLMHARIVRGATEIGGSCIELAHAGSRLVLDLGLPLTDDDDELPPVPGDDLLGVVVSHAHPDHMGLVTKLPDSVPVYGPADAQRMLAAGA